jgi:AcrR family transcriptional regulator
MTGKKQGRATAAGREAGSGGYRKGEASRLRLLETALEVFGAEGYQAATTRRIAEEAGVTLPALQYYFGGKEGLYLACAEEIVRRYAEAAGAKAAEAALALDGALSRDDARALLKDIMAALTEFLAGSSGVGASAAFVARELGAPGPAFDLLYQNLWRPGAEVVAALIVRINGERKITEAARIQAHLLISGLAAFQTGRRVSLRTLGWQDLGERETALIKNALFAQIEAL